MTKFRERMQATGASMRILADVAGVSSSLVCYIAQGYAHFPEYEQPCRVCDFMHCKPTDLYTRTELRRWYKDVPIEPRRPSKEGSRTVRLDPESCAYLRRRCGTEGRLSDAIRSLIFDMKAVEEQRRRDYERLCGGNK